MLLNCTNLFKIVQELDVAQYKMIINFKKKFHFSLYFDLRNLKINKNICKMPYWDITS